MNSSCVCNFLAGAFARQREHVSYAEIELSAGFHYLKGGVEESRVGVGEVAHGAAQQIEIVPVLDSRADARVGSEMFTGGDRLKITEGFIAAPRVGGDPAIRLLFVQFDDPVLEVKQPLAVRDGGIHHGHVGFVVTLPRSGSTGAAGRVGLV